MNTYLKTTIHFYNPPESSKECSYYVIAMLVAISPSTWEKFLDLFVDQNKRKSFRMLLQVKFNEFIKNGSEKIYTEKGLLEDIKNAIRGKLRRTENQYEVPTYNPQLIEKNIMDKMQAINFAASYKLDYDALDLNEVNFLLLCLFEKNIILTLPKSNLDCKNYADIEKKIYLRVKNGVKINNADDIEKKLQTYKIEASNTIHDVAELYLTGSDGKGYFINFSKENVIVKNSKTIDSFTEKYGFHLYCNSERSTFSLSILEKNELNGQYTTLCSCDTRFSNVRFKKFSNNKIPIIILLRDLFNECCKNALCPQELKNCTTNKNALHVCPMKKLGYSKKHCVLTVGDIETEEKHYVVLNDSSLLVVAAHFQAFIHSKALKSEIDRYRNKNSIPFYLLFGTKNLLFLGGVIFLVIGGIGAGFGTLAGILDEKQSFKRFHVTQDIIGKNLNPLKRGALIGGSVSSIVAIVLLLIVGFYIYKQRKKSTVVINHPAQGDSKYEKNSL